MRQGFSGAFKRLVAPTVFGLSLGLVFSACASNSGGGGSPSLSQRAPSLLLPIPSRPHHVPMAMTVEELVKLSGDPCDSAVVDSQCTNDEDDIKFIPDCDAGGYHAVVSKRTGAELLNRVPPRDDSRVAVLAHDTVVCIQGIARIGTYPAYLFVTADAASVGSKKCEQVAPGRFEGGCAIGWVDRDDMRLLGNTK